MDGAALRAAMQLYQADASADASIASVDSSAPRRIHTHLLPKPGSGVRETTSAALDIVTAFLYTGRVCPEFTSSGNILPSRP